MLFSKQSKDKDFSDYVPLVFSFTQSTEEKRRNSFDRYERLIKRQKAITSAVDNSSADTGNEGEENVEESVEKAVQVDLIKILVEDKSLQTEKLTLPQEIHSKSLYNTIKKDNKLFNFIQVCQTIPFFFEFILLSVKENFLYVQS